MNTFSFDVNRWLQSRPHITPGRSFPFGAYSCTPLLSDAAEGDTARQPAAFLLSLGKRIEVIEPDGPNQSLWRSLLLEMEQWQVHAEGVEKNSSSEYWCG